MRYLETSKPQLTINKYDPCNHGQNKQGIIKEVRKTQLGMFILDFLGDRLPVVENRF